MCNAERMQKPTVSPAQLLSLSCKNGNVGLVLQTLKREGPKPPPRTVLHIPQNNFIKLSWSVPDTNSRVGQQTSTLMASVVGDDLDGDGQPPQHNMERAVLTPLPLGRRALALQELQQVQNGRPLVLGPLRCLPGFTSGLSRFPPGGRGGILRHAPRSGLRGRGFTSLCCGGLPGLRGSGSVFSCRGPGFRGCVVPPSCRGRGCWGNRPGPWGGGPLPP